ncbi:MAG: hypothetical protein ACRC78_11200, partial [Planktothrix sp.]
MASILNIHTKQICLDKRARLVLGDMPVCTFFPSFAVPPPLYLSQSEFIRLCSLKTKIHRFRSHPVMNQKPQDLRRSAAEKF